MKVALENVFAAAQDTRHTLKLLNHYGVRTRLISFHEHNEHYREAQVSPCVSLHAGVGCSFSAHIKLLACALVVALML